MLGVGGKMNGVSCIFVDNNAAFDGATLGGMGDNIDKAFWCGK